MPVPLCDLQAQYNELKQETDAALLGAVAAGNYILGPNVKAFESEVADYLGCKYAVGVGNGTDALYLALRALKIGPGDEVITTPFTFIATTEAIQLVGATPVFVDIERDSYNLDVSLVERAITSRTRAIIPVHLYGRPCSMDPLMAIAAKHQLRIVEDCAQSFGARYRGKQTGTIGDVGCLSFFPSKNLGCLGDGGMIVTNDLEIYQRAEILRRHGGKVKYHHTELGMNSRLDEIQAAVLRLRLKRIEAWNEARRAASERYRQLLGQHTDFQLPLSDNRDSYSVFHQYTLLCSDREELSQRLNAQKIGNAVYYPVPLHLQEVNQYLGYQAGDFPQAEYAAKHCLSLPMFPHLTEAQQKLVAEVLCSSCVAPKMAA